MKKFRSSIRALDSSKKISTLRIMSRSNPSQQLGIIFRNRKILGRIDLTEAQRILQVSVIHFKKGIQISPHAHHPVERATSGTSECWIVFKGRLEISIFDFTNEFIGKWTIQKGDCVVFFQGGHSLKTLRKNTVIYEIKNGPYKNSKTDKYLI